tara:strand:- start:1280 stop:3124 length:1845 start_codon:yes stop_codon:yes gene_type:complete
MIYLKCIPLILLFFQFTFVNANEELYEKRLSEANIKIEKIKNSSKICKGLNYKKWNDCYAEYLFPRGTYKGQWKNGMLDGMGMYTEVWGGIYIGEYKNNNANGKGTYFLKSGTIFEGDFKNDLAHGKVKYVSEYGDEIIGDFKEHKADGYAIEIKANGIKYEGEWKNDLYHGKGKQFFPEGTDVDLVSAEGDYVEGYRHGYGRLNYLGGCFYVGEIEYDWEEGQGQIDCTLDETQEWLTYNGAWAGAYENGFGKVLFKNGNRYEGEFLDSVIHGKGKFFYKNGEIYEGNFKAAKKTGFGKMTYEDGSEYSGEWLENLRNGQGEMMFSNGDIYKGEWLEDWEHGRGILTYHTGEKYAGLFQNGIKLEGKTSLPEFTTNEKYFGLIIGNNDYQNLEKLDAAENDAKGVAEVLEKKYGFNNTLLLNANYDEIANAIINFTKNRNETDNLLIYYAGHGELVKDENRGYWLPVDAGAEQDAKWLGNDNIKNWIRRSQAKHILLIVDSCFAGSVLRGNEDFTKKIKISKNQIERFKLLKTRLAITSGGNTPVVDSDGGEHSFFADKLIRTLQENEQVIASSDLFINVRKYVIDNAAQTPNMSGIHGTGHDGGEFLFYPNS